MGYFFMGDDSKSSLSIFLQYELFNFYAIIFLNIQKYV